jgi:hypothetical protein
MGTLMNRRNFLSTLIGGVAATVAVRTFPFRVFSFPKEIEYRPYAMKIAYVFNREVVGVGIYRWPVGGNDFVHTETLSLAEAHARYGYEYTRTAQITAILV